MKGNQLTLKQKSSVASPICCAAAGQRCILVVGGLQSKTRAGRMPLAVEALEKNNQEAIINAE
jgi:hypothetical protein